KVGALDVGRAKAALSAAAHLHASFWPAPSTSPSALSSAQQQQQGIQQRQRQQQQQQQQRSSSNSSSSSSGGGRYPRGLHEQGTFWSLEKRDPGDLAGLEGEYRELLRRFRPLLPPTWFEN
ncbi:unnamed protein product, partial [Laminaria digitata]